MERTQVPSRPCGLMSSCVGCLIYFMIKEPKWHSELWGGNERQRWYFQGVYFAVSQVLIPCNVWVLCSCRWCRWRSGVPGRGSAGWTGAWRPAAGCAGSATAQNCGLTPWWDAATWWCGCCGPHNRSCPGHPLCAPIWQSEGDGRCNKQKEIQE